MTLLVSIHTLSRPSLPFFVDKLTFKCSLSPSHGQPGFSQDNTVHANSFSTALSRKHCRKNSQYNHATRQLQALIIIIDYVTNVLVSSVYLILAYLSQCYFCATKAGNLKGFTVCEERGQQLTVSKPENHECSMEGWGLRNHAHARAPCVRTSLESL